MGNANAAEELSSTAQALVAPGKGILAADESTGTIEKRFKSISVPSTEENRRRYRQMLFTTGRIGDHVSGAILYDETIRQKGSDGTPFPEVLRRAGVIPGIKVDTGTKPLPGCPNEVVTEGLDGLRERLAGYRDLGARFAKWRAVITIGDGLPTETCLHVNAHALARYAALCQEALLVPIVEPEVLMDGAHPIERCYEVTRSALDTVFAELRFQRVRLEGMLLKPNMVIAGGKCPRQASVQDVARETVCCLRRTVPASVPGIVFLSGGQSDVVATEHLDAMNRIGPHPWRLSFSYGRALQHPAMAAWKGEPSRVPAAQKIFFHRARMNGAAAAGKYSAALEREAAAAS
ncbi:MAG: fructose-bisphosphate aldolase class I [Planctomycetes bacterium]|nr:fructose-bisphosphate aldolase class I [Planctomycetota bacterium]